jgi:hypothetical protein
VYEFSIYAGTVHYSPVGSGSGQYRGFLPIDGGARRRLLMFSAEGQRPATVELLLEQLGKSYLDPRDNPDITATRGEKPQRADGTPPGN